MLMMRTETSKNMSNGVSFELVSSLINHQIQDAPAVLLSCFSVGVGGRSDGRWTKFVLIPCRSGSIHIKIRSDLILVNIKAVRMNLDADQTAPTGNQTEFGPMPIRLPLIPSVFGQKKVNSFCLSLSIAISFYFFNCFSTAVKVC